MDQGGRIFLFRRQKANMGEFWITPGGQIEEGEEEKEALRRELEEEIGRAPMWIGPFLFEDIMWEEGISPPLKRQNRYYRVVCSPEELALLQSRLLDEGKWWSLEELLTTQALILPRDLPFKIGRLSLSHSHKEP